MNYKSQSFAIDNLATLKSQMLNWANQFNICCFLDNCNSQDNYHTQEIILAVEVLSEFKITGNSANWKNELNSFIKTHSSFYFGHIAYNFKSVIANEPIVEDYNFPLLYFFQPKILIKYKKGLLEINSIDVEPNIVFESIKQFSTSSTDKKNIGNQLKIKAKQTKEQYIQAINALKHEIATGNCYELNYCTEFCIENVPIHPVEVYLQLTNISPTPFASFYKYNNDYVLSASPERFIKKIGTKIISQPIKGTIKTDNTNQLQDKILIETLKNSKKDKAENVMVVDLVRNDLSKVCNPGTVKVEELFGIYSFKQVHQMISTVIGDLNTNSTFADIIEASFPMGSMTGAPKHKVMQLIEQYETMKRGIYSGCIGYINDVGDFDFNVVIRSIFYNKQTKELSYKVGSGITHYSIANDEYEECLLKAKAIEQVLALNQ
ncbi:MAG: anthranilate synthase component I family protein [Chitinophagaceae bacterium]